MIFKSRTTKASSNVMEQKACNRSPGSSMSFTRTSVISTSGLLTTFATSLVPAASTASPHGKDATDPGCL